MRPLGQQCVPEAWAGMETCRSPGASSGDGKRRAGRRVHPCGQAQRCATKDAADVYAHHEFHAGEREHHAGLHQRQLTAMACAAIVQNCRIAGPE